MDDNNVEESYKKFQHSLCQYLSKPIKDFASLKPQILKILQTHRPIRVMDYQYGISKTGKKRCQLIVHEFNDRSMVREYFKAGMNAWRCCECNRTPAASDSHDSTLINDLLIEHGIVFVKCEHDCKPRQHSFVLKVQKLYKDGKFDEANSLQKSILGSEDLNVLLKQKTIAARKTIRCLNDTEKATAVINLQYAKEKEKDVQHHHRSFMDVIPEALSPEAAFEKIVENLKEYTNENAEVVLLNKSKILIVLKAYRPVKMGDYFYGLSQACKPNERLIVFEWNDRKSVREYSKRSFTDSVWDCRECFKMWLAHRRYGKEEHKYSFLRILCDIKFVQIKHDCLPRSYRLVMQYQKFLEEGETTKARTLARRVGFTSDDNSFANTVNVLNDTCALNSENMSSAEKRKEVYGNESDTETSTYLKRKIQHDIENDGNSSDDKQPLQKKSKLIKSSSKDTVEDENGSAMTGEDITVIKITKRKKNKIGCDEQPSTFMNEIDNSSLINDESQNNNKTTKRKKKNENVMNGEDDSLVHQKSEADVKIEEKQIPTTFAFVKPSTSTLEEICSKLNIPYRNKVTKLWDKIIFEQINIVTRPVDIKTHNFKTENFYEILSKLFTGKSTQHEKIQEKIIEAFRQKLVVSSGEMSSKKFNKLYLNNSTVTDKLLSFIARFMKCRILIFDGEEMKKYGKWNSRLSNRLTFVLLFSDGFYSIVLYL